jgi:hypothetical protein
MKHNKSLSARIRRRNANGFIGIGTGKSVNSEGEVIGFNTNRVFGDYTDSEQNHKKHDYDVSNALKSKRGFNQANSLRIGNNGIPMYVPMKKDRCMSKKFAVDKRK